MRITVGDLVQQLKLYDDDAEVHFEGLSFYRVKGRGPKLVQIEFGEVVQKKDEHTVIIN